MEQKIFSVKRWLNLLMMLVSTNLFAQSGNTSSIVIGVVMPDRVKDIPDEMLPLLQAKIEAIVSSQGLSADGASSQSFVIYPILSVFGKQQTAGGMQKLTIVSGNLSLVIKQVATKTVFSSISKNIQGSGFSAEEATRDIFNQLNSADEELVNFVEKAKTKIVAYYNQGCGNLIKKAESERMQKKYESALSILLSVPVEASGCYDRVQSQAKIVYTEAMKLGCAKFVQEARTYAAANDYESALQRLSWIDPTVGCGTEAKALVNKIAKEVDEDRQKEWSLLFAIHKGKVEVAKAKTYAMNNYSQYWLTAQPTLVTYPSLTK